MIKLQPRFAKLGEKFFSYTNPTALNAKAHLVHKNIPLLQELGINDIQQSQLINLTAGKELLADYKSLASIYMGHQFGVPVPQLGDGRAIIIAEHEDPKGKVWEFQLKGAGMTPYSRMGDGRAVLRSSIREYLASHAMNALNIPTTLALSIITSDDPVYREEVETAAIVMRAAPSFIRFGHFELFASRQQLQELKTLVDFVAQYYFPDLDQDSDDYIPAFLTKVVQLTAEMIAHRQSVGFVHGVMNSDNMSILGLTIDYGPYAFLDQFHPGQIFNHSDSEGRYTYLKQPDIAWWNLFRLAEALFAICDNSDKLEEVLHQYGELYNDKYTELMAAKLGIIKFEPADLNLLDDLLMILQKYHVDWTYFWRQLSHGESGKLQLAQYYPHLLEENFWNKLANRYLLDNLDLEIRQTQMLKANPAITLRTHLLQNAISRAKLGDYKEVDRLFNAISDPYNEKEIYNDYYKPVLNQSSVILSCSS